MGKRVRCVSPHGGSHHGMYHDGTPVMPAWDAAKGGHVVPDVPAEKLRLPANPGGWIQDSRIPGGFAAVGQVYDVADDFDVADGFHWAPHEDEGSG